MSQVAHHKRHFRLLIPLDLRWLYQLMSQVDHHKRHFRFLIRLVSDV